MSLIFNPTSRFGSYEAMISSCWCCITCDYKLVLGRVCADLYCLIANSELIKHVAAPLAYYSLLAWGLFCSKCSCPYFMLCLEWCAETWIFRHRTEWDQRQALSRDRLIIPGTTLKDDPAKVVAGKCFKCLFIQKYHILTIVKIVIPSIGTLIVPIKSSIRYSILGNYVNVSSNNWLKTRGTSTLTSQHPA